MPSPAPLSADPQLGVVLVDHGSRRAESNEQLFELVARLQHRSGLEIVEPAHLELVEPSIATAIRRAVQRGARRIVVCPFFLLPGRHWYEDIPQMAQKAADECGGVEVHVADPLGIDPRMVDVLCERIAESLTSGPSEHGPGTHD